MQNISVFILEKRNYTLMNIQCSFTHLFCGSGLQTDEWEALTFNSSLAVTKSHIGCIVTAIEILPSNFVVSESVLRAAIGCPVILKGKSFAHSFGSICKVNKAAKTHVIAWYKNMISSGVDEKSHF